MKPKKYSNLGFVGHTPQKVLNKAGEQMILVMAPNIVAVPMEQYDDLLDEMLENMTDQESHWVYIWDTHLLGKEEMN